MVSAGRKDFEMDTDKITGITGNAVRTLTWAADFVQTPFGMFCVQVITVFCISEFLIRMPLKQGVLVLMDKTAKVERFIYNTGGLAGNLLIGIIFATLINWGQGFRSVGILSFTLVGISLGLHQGWIKLLDYLVNRKKKK